MRESQDTSKEKPMLFKDMSAAELREAYWFQRRLIARYGDMATLPAPSRPIRSVMAGRAFRAWNRLDLIVNVARKRGINLLEEKE